MFDRRPAAALADPQERVAEIVARHGDLLLRVARAYSLCTDDAHDAVQRALEIYMRRVESLDPATELAWLKVVVKHEALAVRRGRAGVSGEEVDLDAVPAAGQRSVEERLESSERVERSAEVMRRLKRDEARALMLKAEGLSYNEIGERLGWTYTKVNRCITEGRRRFMRLYEELESGAECERLTPTLVALAEGTLTSDALLDLRPHLRNCAGCRATVRALHASRLRRLTAFAPIAALVAPARAFIERFRGAPERLPSADELRPMERQQELEEMFRRLNSGEAAVQPVAPAVAEGAGRVTHARLNLRAWLEGAIQRLQSSDLVVGVHAASTSGGGRLASVAALIGICVSGVGAGTYCVATALLPDPKPAVVHQEAKPTAKRKATEKKLVRLPAPASRAAVATATPAPAAPRRPTGASTTTRAGGSRSAARNGPSASPDEFSFEATSGSTNAPAASTATESPVSSGSGFETGSGTQSASAGRREFDDGRAEEFGP